MTITLLFQRGVARQEALASPARPAPGDRVSAAGERSGSVARGSCTSGARVTVACQILVDPVTLNPRTVLYLPPRTERRPLQWPVRLAPVASGIEPPSENESDVSFS